MFQSFAQSQSHAEGQHAEAPGQQGEGDGPVCTPANLQDEWREGAARLIEHGYELTHEYLGFITMNRLLYTKEVFQGESVEVDKLNEPTSSSNTGATASTSASSSSSGKSNEVVHDHVGSDNEKKETEGEETDRDRCAICLQAYQPGETLITLDCVGTHRFHEECAMPWLLERGQCPSCRDCVVGPPPHYYRNTRNGGRTALEVVGFLGGDGRQLGAGNMFLGQTDNGLLGPLASSGAAWGSFVARFRRMNRGINQSRPITRLLSDDDEGEAVEQQTQQAQTEAQTEESNDEVEL